MTGQAQHATDPDEISQKELVIDGCFVLHSATFGTYLNSCRS